MGHIGNSMNDDQVLILESSPRARLFIVESLQDRSDMSFVVVDTVDKALVELQRGFYGRFRTNFVNEALPPGQSVLYAKEALAIAVSSRIKTEIWTGNSLEQTAALTIMMVPDFSGHVDFYSKHGESITWFTAEEKIYKQSSGKEGQYGDPRKET